MEVEAELLPWETPQAVAMIAVAAWKRKAALAEETLVLCYKARDLLHKYCVHIHVRGKAQRVEVDAKALGALCEYVEEVLIPMDKALFKAIDEVVFRVMATFGDDVAGVLAEIHEAYRAIVYDFRSVLLDGLSKEANPIVYTILTIEPNADEPKIVKVRVDPAVKTLELALRPVLDGQPFRR